MLDHERLDVYRAALEFVDLSLRLIEVLPRGHSPLADQLRRSAMSVPLNIAEAAGKATPERGQFHRIARGSAMECGALIDVIRLLHVADDRELDRAKELLVRVVSMLTRMCH